METFLTFGAVLALGLYVCSQIMSYVESNIQEKNLKKNLEEFDKNNKNDR